MEKKKRVSNTAGEEHSALLQVSQVAQGLALIHSGHFACGAAFLALLSDKSFCFRQCDFV